MKRHFTGWLDWGVYSAASFLLLIPFFTVGSWKHICAALLAGMLFSIINAVRRDIHER